MSAAARKRKRRTGICPPGLRVVSAASLQRKAARAGLLSRVPVRPAKQAWDRHGDSSRPSRSVLCKAGTTMRCRNRPHPESNGLLPARTLPVMPRSHPAIGEVRALCGAAECGSRFCQGIDRAGVSAGFRGPRASAIGVPRRRCRRGSIGSSARTGIKLSEAAQGVKWIPACAGMTPWGWSRPPHPGLHR